MTIRQINIIDDLQDLKALADRAFSSTPDSSIEQWFSFDEMKRLIQNNIGICLKAVDDEDKIIGMTFAQQESPVNGFESKEKWVIIIAAVDPENSGKGVGTELLNALEEKLRKTSCKKLFVYTNKGDDQVINFYHKNGYEDAGWIKDYQYGRGNSAVFLLKYL